MKFVKKTIVFILVIILSPFFNQVFSADLLRVNFQVEPKPKEGSTDYCLTNTATATDSASQERSSSSITTQIGEAQCETDTNNIFANFAKELTNNLISNCNDYVTTEDFNDGGTCVERSIPESALNRQGLFTEIQVSTLTHGDGYFQCVGLVSATVIGVAGSRVATPLGPAQSTIGKGFGTIPSNTSQEWIEKSSGQKIQPGDFPVWKDSAAGHIAVVVSVEDDNNFTVAQANSPSSGQVDLFGKTIDQTNLAGWIRMKVI